MNWFRKHILGEGSELHRQVYWAWRTYPKAMATTMVQFFALGFSLATLIAVLLR